MPQELREKYVKNAFNPTKHFSFLIRRAFESEKWKRREKSWINSCRRQENTILVMYANRIKISHSFLSQKRMWRKKFALKENPQIEWVTSGRFYGIQMWSVCNLIAGILRKFLINLKNIFLAEFKQLHIFWLNPLSQPSKITS